ncbi:hypothetical protein H4582DRAFT_119104 [Lactarius indigo]|nr:hypothetical protein H4582DRAFT_119104 [Lactarius indigo]
MRKCTSASKEVTFRSMWKWNDEVHPCHYPALCSFFPTAHTLAGNCWLTPQGCPFDRHVYLLVSPVSAGGVTGPGNPCEPFPLESKCILPRTLVTPSDFVVPLLWVAQMLDTFRGRSLTIYPCFPQVKSFFTGPLAFLGLSSKRKCPNREH